MNNLLTNSTHASPYVFELTYEPRVRVLILDHQAASDFLGPIELTFSPFRFVPSPSAEEREEIEQDGENLKLAEPLVPLGLDPIGV